jgi:hypothetical protein
MKLDSFDEEMSASYLIGLQRAYEKSSGDEKASVLFRAIRFCGDQEIAMPYWANEAFAVATMGWSQLRYNSLDEAFGTKKVTSSTIKSKKRNKKIEAAVWEEVELYKKNKLPVPWNHMAETHGASERKIQDLYYKGRFNSMFSKFRKKTP